MKNNERKVAFIVVDIQNDFLDLPGAALPVHGADEYYIWDVQHFIRLLNNRAQDRYNPIYVTRDYHPKNHVSFVTNHSGKNVYDTISLADGRNQILWPEHCIEKSIGSLICLDRDDYLNEIKKGCDVQYDSYSGFKDDGGNETDLNRLLKIDEITDIIIFGLALDYCVKYTALDGIKYGYNVHLIEPLCRGVNKVSSDNALKKMKKDGVKIYTGISNNDIIDICKICKIFNSPYNEIGIKS